MNSVLILYPDEFNCYSKFKRKIDSIVSKMNDFAFVYSKNDNLIESLKKDYEDIEFILKTGIDIDNITHVIIFDDGEAFSEEVNYFNSKNIPIRLIKIQVTRVVNIKKETHYKNLKSSSDYEYIGRGSYWGNPYSMYEDGDDREEVIRKYKYDFDKDIFPKIKKSKVYELAGKRLGCFCKPAACHGDVLADFLNQWDDGK